MIKVECIYDNQYRVEYASNIYDFPYNRLNYKTIQGKRGVEYIDAVATFDIETSTIKDKAESLREGKDCYEGYMYHWQMCIEGYVCFGRTWDEFSLFIGNLKRKYLLNKKRRLVVYCHNLSYEFHFLYKLFLMDEIFATNPHKVIKCIMENVIEFRCSYLLSNMSLSKFIENTPNTHHYKGINDLDYRKIFTPGDELTLRERGYCYNDVLGLYECIKEKLKEDTLVTIPLTSTGYVRRDCRSAMRTKRGNRKNFEETALTLEQYQRLKKAFRGGNTASNRYRTNMILNNVSSYDIASSYPYVMMSELFPIGKFIEIDDVEEYNINKYNSKYCTVGRYIFSNIRVNSNCIIAIPYIPVAKCEKLKNITNYNGRILNGEYIEIYLTNIDFDIIKEQYIWDELYVEEFMASKRGKLPAELRNIIIKYYKDKTLLKNVSGKEYEYSKAKNLLNSIYGMIVTDLLHDEYSFNNGDWEIINNHSEKYLNKYYKNRNNFLPYQWGVYVTAYARRNLQKIIDIIGYDVIYCDTDSVKYVGCYDSEIEEVNKKIIEDNNNQDIKYSVYNPKINSDVYMGVWDKETYRDKSNNKYESYSQFITVGAKKYAYTLGTECHVTVAGLNKKRGGEELEKKGGIKEFKIDTVFFNSGRTVAYYNNDDIHLIKVKDIEIKTASNIAIVDTTYTLGMTDTMMSILNTLEKIPLYDKI